MATYLKGPLEHFLHQMQVTCLRIVRDGKQLPWRRMVLVSVFLNIAIDLALHVSEEKGFDQENSSAKGTDLGYGCYPHDIRDVRFVCQMASSGT